MQTQHDTQLTSNLYQSLYTAWVDGDDVDLAAEITAMLLATMDANPALHPSTKCATSNGVPKHYWSDPLVNVLDLDLFSTYTYSEVAHLVMQCLEDHGVEFTQPVPLPASNSIDALYQLLGLDPTHPTTIPCIVERLGYQVFHLKEKPPLSPSSPKTT